MNILLYSHYYPAPPGLNTRADTLVVHYFAKELLNLGHRVQVVFLSSVPVQRLLKNRFRDVVPFETDYTFEGVPVHLIRYQSLTPHRSFPERFQASIINRRLNAFKRGLGWTADKVFVHFPTEFTGITEIFSENAPVLGDFHNIDISILNKRGGDQAAAFIRRIKTWGYRNKRVLAGLKQVDNRPMTRTYSGIARSLIRPENQLRQKLAHPTGTMRVLYAGQLIPLKNVDILIQAVKTLPFPWELTVVGDGPERERLETLAGPAPNIRFTGRLPREDVVERMREADVFIMLSRPETYGLVYLEAMAQGCLTVASRGEGFDGILLDGENGFLAEPGSAEAAARVLTRIHDLDEDERRRLILAGYDLARSMTEDQTALRFLSANE